MVPRPLLANLELGSVQSLNTATLLETRFTLTPFPTTNRITPNAARRSA
jgi:hypothetical protein